MHACVCMCVCGRAGCVYSHRISVPVTKVSHEGAAVWLPARRRFRSAARASNGFRTRLIICTAATGSSHQLSCCKAGRTWLPPPPRSRWEPLNEVRSGPPGRSRSGHRQERRERVYPPLEGRTVRRGPPHLVVLRQLEPKARVPEADPLGEVGLDRDDAPVRGALTDEAHAPQSGVRVHRPRVDPCGKCVCGGGGTRSRKRRRVGVGASPVDTVATMAGGCVGRALCVWGDGAGCPRCMAQLGCTPTHQ
jgi:hypothetical protein